MAFRLMRRFSTFTKNRLNSNVRVSNNKSPVKNFFLPVVIGIEIFGVAKCEELPTRIHMKPDTLEHEFLIKQACTVNANSATQLLTVTMVAVQDTSRQIREALSQEISLIRQALEWGDRVTPEEHWESLIGVRGKLHDLRHNMSVLNNYMEYAEKLATVVAEISYLSGNTAASDALCHRIEQATSTCTREMNENHLLQTESLNLQQMAISNSTQMEELLSNDSSRPEKKKDIDKKS